jgi:hypothetical protein
MGSGEPRRYRVHNLERMAPNHWGRAADGMAYAEDGRCYSADAKQGAEGAVTFAEMLAKLTGEKIVVLDGKRGGKIVWQSWK